MKITIKSNTNANMPKKGAIILGVMEGKKMLATTKDLDQKSKKSLAKAMDVSNFTGGFEKKLNIVAPAGLPYSRVVLVGMGKPSDLTATKLEKLGGLIDTWANRFLEKEITLVVDDAPGAKMDAAEIAAHIATGVELKSYSFNKYFTTKKPSELPCFEKLNVLVNKDAKAKKLFATLQAINEGVFFTRDLVSEPANIIFPKSFTDQVKKLTKLGVKVEVLDKRKMQQLGMNSLLGVAQGSANDPYLVICRWEGNKGAKDKRPVAFVGKGVTFDTGGISIKPSNGMEEMKWDMGGAATVAGLMMALAKRKAKANVVGLMGMVENMPSGTAQRPGDVVKSMSGQTIEVINTDAEGRLVLADVLWYCQSRFKPKFMINLATLTGAIIVALGHEHAGLFSNNDALAEKITQAGKEMDELVWRLPLADAYDKDINSDIADMKNVGSGRGAGSITAAQFLQRFVNKTPWAHLDIAGTAWSNKPLAVAKKGATGFGVRLLNKLVTDHYES